MLLVHRASTQSSIPSHFWRMSPSRAATCRSARPHRRHCHHRQGHRHRRCVQRVVTIAHALVVKQALVPPGRCISSGQAWRQDARRAAVRLSALSALTRASTMREGLLKPATLQRRCALVIRVWRSRLTPSPKWTHLLRASSQRSKLGWLWLLLR
jgi:hypothetical protein